MAVERQAVFGGGCFWCAEAIFQRLNGVLDIESGYAGGDVADPTYDEVIGGDTGHAEVIQITYDPEIVTYENLVRVHLGTHDPTTPDAQGIDHGTQYRSVILVNDDQERRIAEGIMEEYAAALDDEIVTETRFLDAFYPGEGTHQNYYNNNPTNRYCQFVIDPKLDEFRTTFAHLLA